MTLEGWKQAGYDTRFEMLYSSIVQQNSSWSHTAVALSSSICLHDGDPRPSSSESFQAPVMGRTSRSQRTGHAQPTLTGKGTRQSCSSRRGRLVGAREELRGRRWREVMQASGGSDNGSIVISDEGTDWEAPEENDSGEISIELVDIDRHAAGSIKDDVLWVLEDDGLQGKESVSYAPDAGEERVEFGGIVTDEYDVGKDDASDSLSTASGPTLPEACPLVRCKRCAGLFGRMRKLKSWKKSVEHDPTSLSCDQWVLNKAWRPRTLPKRKGKLWAHLSRIRQKAMSCPEAGEGEKPKTSCSRPHIFLHRNLQRCRAQEAGGHRKPDQTRMKLGYWATGGGAGRGRKQRKRKLCEVAEGMLGKCKADEDTLGLTGDLSCDDAARACRRLDFDGAFGAPDPLRQGKDPLSQNVMQPDIKTDGRRRSATARRRSKTLPPSERSGGLGQYPWVHSGGFRSMLAELTNRRSTVVQELDRLLTR